MFFFLLPIMLYAPMPDSQRYYVHYAHLVLDQYEYCFLNVQHLGLLQVLH